MTNLLRDALRWPRLSVEVTSFSHSQSSSKPDVPNRVPWGIRDLIDLEIRELLSPRD